MERGTGATKTKPRQRILKGDWVWLFAYPAYQLIGTVRHEGSHALSVLLEGGRIVKFVFWPTLDVGFTWGYVRWAGHVTWLTSAAPYAADLLTFAVFFLLCTRLPVRRHWVWVNLYVIGLVSPLVNSGYRYASSFFRDGDLAPVMKAVPPAAVHAYFICTIALYVVGLALIQKNGSPNNGA